MDPVALLAELRALADNIPDFGTFTPSSRVHQEWIGKLHALIEQWKPSEEFSLGMQISWIGIDATRASSVSKIISTLHRAIADLEHRLPPGPDRVFGPGAVYDFFKKGIKSVPAQARWQVCTTTPDRSTPAHED